MLTTHCLKNLIAKFGGTPPKGNSTTACLSELCKSDFHSRTARVETWNLTQNIEIPNKEIIICNFVATAPDNSPRRELILPRLWTAKAKMSASLLFHAKKWTLLIR